MTSTAEASLASPRVSCGYCQRRLEGEYYFTCLRCGGSYCYIHISRHPTERCRVLTRPPPLAVAIERSSANV